MIARIACKEFVEMTRDKRFTVAALIVGGLLLAALALGWQHSRTIKRTHEAAQNQTRRQWLNQESKAPHSAAHYGVYAFKPQLPLAFLDKGVEAFTGVAVWLEAHKQNDFRYRPASDQTVLSRFSELTAASVLQILLPLLIIVLTFAAFAGEREAGTLRMAMSSGIAPRTLTLGKVAGIAGVLGLLIVPAVIVGVAALSLSFAGENSVASFARLALMTLGYLLYLAMFVCIALAVSARASSARTALLVLLGFWIVTCLIAPRAVTDIAKRAVPTPSALTFTSRMETEIRNGADGHNPADKRLADMKLAVMREHNVTRLEDLPFNFDGYAIQAGEEHGNRVFDKHYGALWDKFAAQESMRDGAAILAPVLAVGRLSRGLAGTDYAQHRDFAVAAENHRRALIKTTNEDVMRNARYGDTSYKADAALWRRVPDFNYSAPTTFVAIKEQAASFGVLTLWFIASVALLWWATKRLKVV